MNKIREMDPLRREDWANVYSDVPEEVNIGVKLAFARIRRREARRKKIVRIAACAAALALTVGVCSLALGRRQTDAPDRVSVPVADARILTGGDIVYASNGDDCFHVHGECPEASETAVQLPLVTALEFEKTLCPVCGVNVQIEA